MGYKYTGRDSLYGLTWYEIMDLVDGSEIENEMRDSEGSHVRASDWEKLNALDDRLSVH